MTARFPLKRQLWFTCKGKDTGGRWWGRDWGGRGKILSTWPHSTGHSITMGVIALGGSWMHPPYTTSIPPHPSPIHCLFHPDWHIYSLYWNTPDIRTQAPVINSYLFSCFITTAPDGHCTQYPIAILNFRAAHGKRGGEILARNEFGINRRRKNTLDKLEEEQFRVDFMQ